MPKEDGEIGEAIRDVVARHSDTDSPALQAYRRIEGLKDHATPGMERVVGRSLSAALSPVEGFKASPNTAMECLKEAEMCLRRREVSWAERQYESERIPWPTEEADMQNAVNEKINNMIEDGEALPPGVQSTKRSVGRAR